MLDIEVVIFDIDDTLLPTSDIDSKALAAARSFIAKSHSILLEQFEKTIYEIRRKSANVYFYTTDHFKEYLDGGPSVASDKNLQLAVKMYVAYSDMRIKNMRPYPGVKEFLDYLEKNRYILIAVTRGVPWAQQEKLVRMGLPDRFYQVEVTPSTDKAPALLKVIGEVDSDPSKVVYIGDDPEIDVESAKRAGVTPLRLKQGKRATKDAVRGTLTFSSMTEVAQFFKENVAIPHLEPLESRLKRAS